MARFFLGPEEWGEHADLIGDEAMHCSRVLRAREGDSIVVFDGKGREADARIKSISRNRVSLDLEETRVQVKSKVRVTLAQAVLKGKAMDWLIQKSVELGVSKIQPLITENTVVKAADAKTDKWRRAVLEACKQCGQNHLPRVSPIVELTSYLREERRGSMAIAALAEPRQQLKQFLSAKPDEEAITFLVGPEGDFTEEELAMAQKAGFEPVTLGPQVLRSETAALFGLAAIGYDTR